MIKKTSFLFFAMLISISSFAQPQFDLVGYTSDYLNVGAFHLVPAISAPCEDEIAAAAWNVNTVELCIKAFFIKSTKINVIFSWPCDPVHQNLFC